MIDELLGGICYVVLEFADKSQQLICTTLNADILQHFGVVPKIEYFFDLQKKKYVKFNRKADTVFLMDNLSEISEVTKFVSRYL